MTRSDPTSAKIREFEAYGTAGSTIISTTLGLALLIAQHSSFSAIVSDTNEPNWIRKACTESTVSTSVQPAELNVFKQISRVYDLLLENQVELDIDSKRALYSNLWNLYST